LRFKCREINITFLSLTPFVLLYFRPCFTGFGEFWFQSLCKTLAASVIKKWGVPFTLVTNRARLQDLGWIIFPKPNMYFIYLKYWFHGFNWVNYYFITYVNKMSIILCNKNIKNICLHDKLFFHEFIIRNY
jgi:hypothetical protein